MFVFQNYNEIETHKKIETQNQGDTDLYAENYNELNLYPYHFTFKRYVLHVFYGENEQFSQI